MSEELHKKLKGTHTLPEGSSFDHALNLGRWNREGFGDTDG